MTRADLLDRLEVIVRGQQFDGYCPDCETPVECTATGARSIAETLLDDLERDGLSIERR